MKTSVAEPEGSSLAAENYQVQVDRLGAEQATLESRLEALLDRVKAGEASADERSELNHLLERAAPLARELEAAKREAQSAEHIASINAQTDRRTKFDAVVARAKTERETFEQRFWEACFALGAFCASVEEADGLMRESVTRLGVPQEMASAVIALTTNLDVMNRPTKYKLVPAIGFGWNLSFPVVALRELKGKNEHR